MKEGLKMIAWKVGYRKRCSGILDNCQDFQLIKNPWWGWCADPFLFEKDKEVYIVAEIWNYFKLRGCIGYCKLEKIIHSENGR